MLYPRSLLWWGGWLMLEFVKLNDCTVGLLHKPRYTCMMSASVSVVEKCGLCEVFGHRGLQQLHGESQHSGYGESH